MTSKQILDSFSETLLADERIFSTQERLLVVTLLEHARSARGANRETREAVISVIASAVGEMAAQRAFAVLGRNIVERIVEDHELSFAESTAGRTAEVPGPKDPRARGKDPQTPSRKQPHPADPQAPGDPQTPGGKQPQPPTKPMQAPDDPQLPGRDPQTPGAKSALKEPQSPGQGQTTAVGSHPRVTVVERPESLPANCVVLDEFLAPQELEELTGFTLGHEADFQTSEVISPTEEHGIVNYEHRRSRVLMDLGKHERVILDRIKRVLPQVLEQLGMEEFAIEDVEVEITASNDGDFFHFHSDNSSRKVRSRHLTFVYFFHRDPRHFDGGELRIHDARLEAGVYVSEGSYQTIVPQPNQIVFFPCELMHEITPVECPSQLFSDSRFTVNGWLCR